jgi:hypothetical protein
VIEPDVTPPVPKSHANEPAALENVPVNTDDPAVPMSVCETDGTVRVPMFEILLMTGKVRVLFVRVWVPATVTAVVSETSGNVNTKDDGVTSVGITIPVITHVASNTELTKVCESATPTTVVDVPSGNVTSSLVFVMSLLAAPNLQSERVHVPSKDLFANCPDVVTKENVSFAVSVGNDVVCSLLIFATYTSPVCKLFVYSIAI